MNQNQKLTFCLNENKKSKILNKIQNKAEKASQTTARIRLRTEDCYIKSMRIPTKVL